MHWDTSPVRRGTEGALGRGMGVEKAAFGQSARQALFALAMAIMPPFGRSTRLLLSLIATPLRCLTAFTGSRRIALAIWQLGEPRQRRVCPRRAALRISISPDQECLQLLPHANTLKRAGLFRTASCPGRGTRQVIVGDIYESGGLFTLHLGVRRQIF